MFLAVTVLGAPRAEAAGIVTHAWMADDAVARVGDPALRALLTAHADQVRAGAEFPDGGYITRARNVPGGDYGEEAHWWRFQKAYLERIRARTDCGDLTRADGPCAAEVAHLMGVAAHGMTDQVWDWLFEPNGSDLGEAWIPPELAGVIGPGGLETQMDVIAIVDHHRPTGPTAPLPSEADVLAAFAAAGRPDITVDAVRQGEDGLDFLRTLEGNNAPSYRDAVVANMPWTAAHIRSAPGGIDFGAVAIGGLYDNLWARLQGGDPPTKVTTTYPADGQDDVPATGWLRTYQAGSWPPLAGGGARTRITAVLSGSLPFVASAVDTGTHITAQLPAGAVRLVERDSGAVVPTLAGYPKIVPYDPDPGENLVDLQPAADLTACTWYRVETTDRLRDGDGRAVTPATWTFRTACTPAPPTPAGPAAIPPARPVLASPTFTG